MQKLNILRTVLLGVMVALLFSGLSGCAKLKKWDEDYKAEQAKKENEHPSIFRAFGGQPLSFKIGGSKNRAAAQSASGVAGGIDAALWRAAIEATSTMPIGQIDRANGLIKTEWHASRRNPNEQVQVSVVLFPGQIHYGSARVTAFRRYYDANRQLVTVPADPNSVTAMQQAIVSRALAYKPQTSAR